LALHCTLSCAGNNARICIAIQANQEIPKCYKLKLPKCEPVEIYVEVPWQLSSYSTCNMFGYASRCPIAPMPNVVTEHSKQSLRGKQEKVFESAASSK